MAKGHKAVTSSGSGSGTGSSKKAVSATSAATAQATTQATAQANAAATQQTQQQTNNLPTPANATSSNVKAYFGDNNGGFKDAKDLVANQDKIEAWMDNIADSDLKKFNGKVTSQWLAAEAMGFNAPPNLTDHISSLPDQSDRIVVYRGVSGAQGKTFAEQFKTGEHYAGTGVYGDGSYFQLSYSGAQSYAQWGGGAFGQSASGVNSNIKDSIITASINLKKLKVVSSTDLTRIQSSLLKNPKLSTRVKNLIGDNIISSSSGSTKKSVHTGSDGALGTLATMLGYDAIYVPKGNGGVVPKNQPTNAGKTNDFIVVLNRGAIDVKKGS